MVAAVGLKPRPSEYVYAFLITDRISSALVETIEAFDQGFSPILLTYKYVFCHSGPSHPMKLEQEQLPHFLHDFLYNFGAFLCELVLICFVEQS